MSFQVALHVAHMILQLCWGIPSGAKRTQTWPIWVKNAEGMLETLWEHLQSSLIYLIYCFTCHPLDIIVMLRYTYLMGPRALWLTYIGWECWGHAGVTLGTFTIMSSLSKMSFWVASHIAHMILQLCRDIPNGAKGTLTDLYRLRMLRACQSHFRNIYNHLQFI